MKTRTIAGKECQLVLLKLKSREKGRPKEATILYDEDVEKLQGGEEYVTAWVPVEAVKAEKTN